jgi:hypothetical protein
MITRTANAVEVTGTYCGGRVFDASSHLLRSNLANQSAVTCTGNRVVHVTCRYSVCGIYCVNIVFT